jgi:hypothetical protein
MKEIMAKIMAKAGIENNQSQKKISKVMKINIEMKKIINEINESGIENGNIIS